MVYKGLAYVVVALSVFSAFHDLYKFDQYLKTTKANFIAKVVNFIVTTILVTFDLYIGKYIVDYLEELAHGI